MDKIWQRGVIKYLQWDNTWHSPCYCNFFVLRQFVQLYLLNLTLFSFNPVIAEEGGDETDAKKLTKDLNKRMKMAKSRPEMDANADHEEREEEVEKPKKKKKKGKKGKKAPPPEDE